MDMETIANQLENIDILQLRIELFRQGNFDFIVEGIAENSEGDWTEDDIATHEKQRKALKILTDSEHDEFLYGGAAGGAKSWTGVTWLVFSCLCYEDTNWFIARNQLKDLLGSVLKTFRKVCKEYGITDYNFNAQKNYIEFPNGSVINLIEVSYKPSDPMYEDLGSTEYTGGWIEEIGEINEMAFIVLGTRIGRHLNKKHSIKKKLFLTCNPKQNWAKTMFYDKHVNGSLYQDNKKLLENKRKRAQRIYLNCLVTENPFIEQDYIDGLYSTALNNKATYERLLKGNWDYEDNPYQLAEQEMIDSVFDNDHIQNGKNYLTADIARYGADRAVFIAWKGWVAKKIITLDKSSLQDNTLAINSLRREFRIPKHRCVADGDGVGGFAIDATGIKSFKNNGKVIKVNKETPNYKNLQVQCLYRLADKINEGVLHIEEEGIDTSSTKINKRDIMIYIKQELAQIQSVPNKRDADKLDCKMKSDIKIDLGRSPDFRDALMMRMWFDLRKPVALETTWN